MSSVTETCASDIGRLFALNARRLGDKAAIIIDEKTSISYGELDLRAKVLASKLIKHGLVYEDPVGILTAFGACHIIAQVAIVYAGGTCLPLDLCRPDRDLQVQLNLAEVKFLVVDETCQNRQLSVNSVSVVTSQKTVGPDYSVPNVPRSVQPDFRSHILFTSGSTGLPKAVQVPARGVLRIARDQLCKPDSGEDRFAHLNNTCFDVSLIDIWVALLNGATIVVLDRQELFSPEVFVHSLKEKRVTYMFMTAALFHIVALACPTAFSELKTLIVGGESPSMAACSVVLENGPPRRLINGYGPSECSILALGHLLTSEDIARGYLPIGKPLEQTVAYVLDGSLRPVTGQNSGELYLGGAGLFRGYLHNPEQTTQALVTIPGLGSNGEADRLYRTGDVVYTDNEGNVVWLGRKDREVKIRGYRVPLDVVETELLLTGLVSSAAALRVDTPGFNTTLLVACVTYITPTTSNDALFAKAKVRLPTYMVPQLVAFEKMPMTPQGKVDREQVSKILSDMLQQRQDRDALNEAKDSDALNWPENELKALWSRILIAIPEKHIRPEADFFAAGATSLDVISLITGVREVLGILLTAQIIYEHSDFKSLAEFIKGQKDGTSASHLEKLKDALRADAATLWQDIPTPTGPPVDWMCAEEGNVFVTGATGFLGAYLLIELLRLPTVRSVRCLVRAESRQSAFEKVFRNLAKYRLRNLSKDLESKIDVIPGDLSEARMGLSESDYHELSGWASIIYHLGAQVNFNEPYTANFSTNVQGTLHVLRLAATGKPKSVHYASTIAAFGPTGLVRDEVKELGEDDPLTPYVETTLPYDIGYSQSQWVTDEIISHLMRRGFPAAIYRLGTVLCNSDDGVGNPEDFVSRLLTDCITLGTYPSMPDQREELVPVDYVASVMRLISMSNENLGRAYHVTPDAKSSIDTNDLFCLAGQICKIEMTELQYRDWVEKLQGAAMGGSDLRMKPLLPALQEKVVGELTVWEAYEGMARFKTDNTVAALKKTAGYKSLRTSAINGDDLKVYLRWLLLRD
ncbi:AMP-binding enzyme [Hirsutella rhossiliensis]